MNCKTQLCRGKATVHDKATSDERMASEQVNLKTTTVLTENNLLNTVSDANTVGTRTRGDIDHKLGVYNQWCMCSINKC